MTEISVGLSYLSFDYREELRSPLRSREVGRVPFLDLGIRAEPESWKGTSFNADLSVAFRGVTTYEGSDLNTEKEVSDRDLHSMYFVDGIFEIPFSSSISLLAGVSSRYWNRWLAYGTGYREIYQWWTLPLGFKMVFADIGKSWWTLEATFRPMIRGDIRIIFSESVIDGENTNLTLGHRPGWRLRASYRSFIGRWEWSVAPVIESYGFGGGNSAYNGTPGITGVITEPASTTWIYGASLIFSKRF